ncbi:MAG: amino acid carrier protein [Clostridiales bacterium]|jgi:AGCS family alanine or glycine:cation symporter|nr:amino acid carrier protein [Clostridiales bacterium]
MLNTIAEINQKIWIPVYILLFVSGFYFSVLTNFLQIRKFFYVLKNTLGKIFENNKKIEKNSLSQWQALATALGSTIGTGNVIGTTAAIITGGPGSILWLWIFAILGMITKYAEILLALKYREKDEKHGYSGGPMYYIRNGMKKNKLAFIFALILILSSLNIVNLQINSIALSIKDLTGIENYISGLFFAFLVGLVIVGGVKRIGSFSDKAVPFMVIIYFLGAIFTIFTNIDKIIPAFALIFSDAFKFKTAGSGLLGYTISSAIHYGVARGGQSCEAGLGTAPIVHATAEVDHPVKQGIYGILEVFVSSFIICTMTALVILTTGIYNRNVYDIVLSKSGIAGLNNLDNAVTLVSKSFESAMGLKLGGLFLSITIIFFSITTIIGWALYGEKAVLFIFNKKKYVFIYKIIFLTTIIIGSISNINFLWEINDISNALMFILNLIALISLRKIVIDITKSFFNKKIKS